MSKTAERKQRMGLGGAAALLALALGLPAAAATEGHESRRETPPSAARTYGKTLPPVGFVEFCRRQPDACVPRHAPAARQHLSHAQWDAVYRINAFINAGVAPARDQDLYGEPEYWAYPAGAGDCEDYALLKQRYLEKLGLARGALLLTVVLDNDNEGHAVLTLATSEGDFILDNRRNAIRRWSDLDYTFLKRQSQRDPREWVSLAARHFDTESLAIRSTRE